MIMNQKKKEKEITHDEILSVNQKVMERFPVSIENGKPDSNIKSLFSDSEKQTETSMHVLELKIFM